MRRCLWGTKVLVGFNFCIANVVLTEEERDSPVSALRAKRRDVLVTTDGATRGVSLPDMRHVIAFDLAKDVDTYGTRRPLLVFTTKSPYSTENVSHWRRANRFDNDAHQSQQRKAFADCA